MFTLHHFPVSGSLKYFVAGLVEIGTNHNGFSERLDVSVFFPAQPASVRSKFSKFKIQKQGVLA